MRVQWERGKMRSRFLRLRRRRRLRHIRLLSAAASPPGAKRMTKMKMQH
jgi:hypothetical protein